jgi:DNA-binding LacI/PurR family transcriptional regulator
MFFFLPKELMKKLFLICIFGLTMRKGPISLKDIAKELNLSISTVSRAIRNVGEVSPETREAVRQLARNLRYKPNPLATGLLKNQTRSIGVILPEIENYFFANLLRGMDKLASENDYRLVTFFSNNVCAEEMKSLEELVFFRIDGIIACPANDSVSFDHYTRLIENDIPVVIVDRDFPDLVVPKVLTDNYKATSRVIEHLVAGGRKRIALIANLEPLSVGRQRYDAYVDCMQYYHLPFDRDLIVHGNLGISTTVEATRGLLALPSPPDAIIGSDDAVAMVAMKIVKEHGLRVPEDISLVGFNDEPFASFLEPTLTSVAQPSYLMGMKAVELLLKQMDGSKTPSFPEKIVLESGLVIRNSSQ